jgi:hypothetical protein
MHSIRLAGPGQPEVCDVWASGGLYARRPNRRDKPEECGVWASGGLYAGRPNRRDKPGGSPE